MINLDSKTQILFSSTYFYGYKFYLFLNDDIDFLEKDDWKDLLQLFEKYLEDQGFINVGDTLSEFMLHFAFILCPDGKWNSGRNIKKHFQRYFWSAIPGDLQTYGYHEKDIQDQLNSNFLLWKQLVDKEKLNNLNSKTYQLSKS